MRRPALRTATAALALTALLGACTVNEDEDGEGGTTVIEDGGDSSGEGSSGTEGGSGEETGTDGGTGTEGGTEGEAEVEGEVETGG